MTLSPFAVELHSISKRFGKVTANKNISLKVRRGSIHAVVGENGAGKSTLMNILYGMIRPDEGSIAINGAACTLRNPADAIGRGIAMVHQHFMLVPTFTVLENIILGAEPVGRANLLSPGAAAAKVAELSRAFLLPIEPYELVSGLSVGMQQRVEILKVLYRNADIVIFDEPTGVLTPQEVDGLMATLRLLQKEGKTILLITHKLSETFDLSDEITVLRRGEAVLTIETARATKASITEAIIGRQLVPPQESGRAAASTPFLPPVISLRGCSLVEKSKPLLRDVSLDVRAGEILGIAGVEGSGQSVLSDILAGRRRQSGGDLRRSDAFDGDAVAYIPEDRHKEGLILDFTILENLILGRADEFTKGVFLDERLISTFANDVIQRYNVSPNDPALPAKALSGGNQQKIVIGREISKDAVLILAHQPTRGLDIGAREFVHNILRAQRDAGKAVIVFSSDLTELLELADRIGVMFDGSISAVEETEHWTERSLGAVMTGSGHSPGVSR